MALDVVQAHLLLFHNLSELFVDLVDLLDTIRELLDLLAPLASNERGYLLVVVKALEQRRLEVPLSQAHRWGAELPGVTLHPWHFSLLFRHVMNDLREAPLLPLVVPPQLVPHARFVARVASLSGVLQALGEHPRHQQALLLAAAGENVQVVSRAHALVRRAHQTGDGVDLLHLVRELVQGVHKAAHLGVALRRLDAHGVGAGALKRSVPRRHLYRRRTPARIRKAEVRKRALGRGSATGLFGVGTVLRVL
eukprot:scaffold1913_cov257-Pinguiococcus_pyrenoidosus.AAC.10